jgi:hypothetical protein
MTDEQKLYPWRDGLPTKPDVDALNAHWPTLAVGDRLEKAEIAGVMGSPSETRFNTVLGVWRKQLAERGIDLQCERGTGMYYVSTPEQTISDTHGVFTSAARKFKRHRVRLNIAGAHSKDDATRTVVEHQGRAVHIAEREAKKQRMNLLPQTSAPQQPQITPPTQKSMKSAFVRPERP